MNAKAQLAIAEKAVLDLANAGVRVALVCSFPSGGTAFLSVGDAAEQNEDGETLPQLMRHFAKHLRAGVINANKIGGSEE